ncbi:MAG: PAS domain-containing protein, partial [Pirellulaceae bacterium]
MDQIQFLQFANTLPEAMLLVTAEGLVLAANQAAVEDLKLQHLVGARLHDLVVDDAEKVAKFLKLCRRSRNFTLGSFGFRRSSGASIEFRVEGALVQPKSVESPAVVMLRLTSKATALHQFVVLNRRIDDLGRELQLRMQAEARARVEQEKLRVTLNSIGDAVIATDEHGMVTMLNPFAERFTGWTIAEAIGTPLVDVFRIINESTRQPVNNPALVALREQRVVALANHTLLIAKDGTEWPIDDSASPIRDEAGRVIGAVLVFRDITDRK